MSRGALGRNATLRKGAYPPTPVAGITLAGGCPAFNDLPVASRRSRAHRRIRGSTARERTPVSRRRRRLLSLRGRARARRDRPAEAPAASASRPKGYDVSSHQKSVNRAKARARGARFVHVKATESTTYRNPHIRQQYDGSRRAGLIRGASRFACPTASRAGRRRRTSYATGAPGEPTGAHCRPLSASHTTRTTARRSATGPARPGRPPASARSATRPTGARAAGL